MIKSWELLSEVSMVIKAGDLLEKCEKIEDIKSIF